MYLGKCLYPSRSLLNESKSRIYQQLYGTEYLLVRIRLPRLFSLLWGKFEHLFSVAMRNFLFVGRTDRGLLKKVVRDRPLQMFCGWRYRLIHASQVEGDHFAPVAQNELETGIAIKDAAQDHAQRMDACLHMPPPPEGRKAGTDNRIKASIVGILHDFGWEGRMQVDGNIQSNGRFENGMK